MKNYRQWEGLTVKKSVEDYVLWEGPHSGAGKVWVVRRKKWQIQPVVNWPQPPLPLRSWGGESRELGSKVEPRKNSGVWGRCIKIYCSLISSLSYFDLFVNKLNNFSKLSLFCHDGNWQVIPPCPYPNPLAMLMLSLFVLQRKGRSSSLGGHLVAPCGHHGYKKTWKIISSFICAHLPFLCVFIATVLEQ